MANVLGMDAKLYYDASGVGGSTWSLLTNVRNLSLAMSASEADVTTRASGGFKQIAAALIDAGVDFEMVYDTADAGFTALQTAFLAKSVIGIAVMDGVITTVGSQGLWADCVVTKFDIGQDLEDAMKVSVTLKLARSTTEPEWTTIAV